MWRDRSALGAAMLLALAVAGSAHADGRSAPPRWEPSEGKQLLGTRAPPWQGLAWIAGGPLTLEGLRGHPVFVRFFSDGCPMCAETAPALNKLQHLYGARGLTVVAIHHPKSPEAHDRAFVARAARQIGLECPVAHDADWATLHAYGVGSIFKSYTSESFLIDGDGVIRFVHDGGTLALGGDAWKVLTAAVERALAPPGK